MAGRFATAARAAALSQRLENTLWTCVTPVTSRPSGVFIRHDNSEEFTLASENARARARAPMTGTRLGAEVAIRKLSEQNGSPN